MMEINEILKRLNSLSEETKDGQTAEALRESCKRLEAFLPKPPLDVKRFYYTPNDGTSFLIGACPSCNTTCTSDMSYCDGCGRAFDWSSYELKE